jgi:hypothetical protein
MLARTLAIRQYREGRFAVVGAGRMRIRPVRRVVADFLLKE